MPRIYDVYISYEAPCQDDCLVPRHQTMERLTRRTMRTSLDFRNTPESRRVIDNGHAPLDRSTLTRRTKLDLPSGMPISAWRNLGRQIFIISDSSGWWLGDWLIYGQNQYPNRYKLAISETSLDYQTLRNYAWVARRFAPERRRERLSFQHHAEVASLPPQQQDIWLDRADVHKWSRNELRRQIRRGLSSKEEDPMEVLRVRINVAPAQKERWQTAAGGSEEALLAWMVECLDRAAARALENGREDVGSDIDEVAEAR